ncbi:MAG: TrkA family potassium uptake protein [Lentisphaerae bacterium]|nr:TrkA family potassium uptake protein [Lentisphaerota bacterium]
MARNSYAVFGMGSFGSKLALELVSGGNTVLVCDRDAAKIEEIRDKVDDAVIADVSAEDTIRELNVSKFDAVILGMSSYFEDQVLALTLLKQEGARKVIVKSSNPIQERILYRLGADEVIQVDLDVAKRLARRLSLANIADLFEFKGSAIADVTVPAELAGQPLRQLDLRNRYNITILVIRDASGANEKAIGPETVLDEGDLLTVFGGQQAIIDLFKGKKS